MAFLQPGEGALHHPSLRYYNKFVCIIALGNLYRRTKNGLYPIGKRLADIIAIGKDIDHF